MKVRMTSKSIFRGKKFEKAHECAIKYYINKVSRPLSAIHTLPSHIIQRIDTFKLRHTTQFIFPHYPVQT